MLPLFDIVLLVDADGISPEGSSLVWFPKSLQCRVEAVCDLDSRFPIAVNCLGVACISPAVGYHLVFWLLVEIGGGEGEVDVTCSWLELEESDLTCSWETFVYIRGVHGGVGTLESGVEYSGCFLTTSRMGRGVIRGNAFEVLTCQTNTNLNGPAVRLLDVSNILMVRCRFLIQSSNVDP